MHDYHEKIIMRTITYPLYLFVNLRSVYFINSMNWFRKIAKQSSGDRWATRTYQPTMISSKPNVEEVEPCRERPERRKTAHVLAFERTVVANAATICKSLFRVRIQRSCGSILLCFRTWLTTGSLASRHAPLGETTSLFKAPTGERMMRHNFDVVMSAFCWCTPMRHFGYSNCFLRKRAQNRGQ